MAPEFKNINELMEYLSQLEKRIEFLESENNYLQNKNFRPQTALINPKFWKRAFAVWGHFMTANFIVSGIGFIIYLCIMLIVVNAITNPTNPPDPATIPTAYPPGYYGIGTHVPIPTP